MPIDNEQIKKALDDFENDNFIDAKEKIQKEIGTAKAEFLQKKLGLEKPLVEPEQKEEEE